MKLVILLLAILFTDVASACAQKLPTAEPPPKPIVDRCVVDAANNGIICKINGKDEFYSKTIVEADNYICFHPDHYKLIDSYAKDMRVIIANKCK